MINTLIFDFGNVFINLKDAYTAEYIKHFESNAHFNAIIDTNLSYEKGEISTNIFLKNYQNYFPEQSEEIIIEKWNSILGDFPEHRLNFIKDLKANTSFKLILLSNTNELHINWIKKHISHFDEFKQSFHKFYLSHEIKMRKPDTCIFEFVLKENKVNAENCLFIDDNKDNIESAKNLNINTWLLNPKKEDVTILFETKKALF